ncbi:MAG: septum formation protein Maf [Clostridia bacterium]|nr:septum formation protein Maf [Clostridia bacterium]
MKNTKFILASASPRRFELLGELGIIPSVCPTDADESITEPLSPAKTVELLSMRKAQAYKKVLSDNEILITADTVVALGNKILGKPKDKQDAIDMLSSLSDTNHTVCTGITLSSKNKTVTVHDMTTVCFRKMTTQEIVDYVETGDPLDKAGAYGIQGEAGKFVKEISGSLNNVIGLPTELVRKILSEEFNIKF